MASTSLGPDGGAPVRGGKKLVQVIVLIVGALAFLVLVTSAWLHLGRLVSRWALALVGAGSIYLLSTILTHVVAVGFAEWLNRKRAPYWLFALALAWFAFKSPETGSPSLPSLANIDSSTVRATADSSDMVDSASLIRIPPDSAIMFLGAETNEWTHDPLDGLAVVVKFIPFAFPFDAPSARGKVKDTTYLHELHETYDSVKRAYPESNTAIEPYVRRLEASLSVGRDLPLITDVRGLPEKEADAATAFFKRAMWLHIWRRPGMVDNPSRRFVLGPFYGALGRAERHADTALRLLHPGDRIGDVVALQVIFDPRLGKFVNTQRIFPFSSYGQRIENSTTRETFVRLLMNDDQPRDNSPDGSATVRYILIAREPTSH